MRNLLEYINESIISNTRIGVTSRYISSNYSEFKLHYVSYEKDGVSIELQSNMLDTFFDVDKVEKYNGKFLKKYNSTSGINKDVVRTNNKFFSQLGNILYNCDFNENNIKEKLEGLVRPGIEISIDDMKMKSGNMYYYYSFVDNTKNDEFMILGYRGKK